MFNITYYFNYIGINLSSINQPWKKSYLITNYYHLLLLSNFYCQILSNGRETKDLNNC